MTHTHTQQTHTHTHTQHTHSHTLYTHSYTTHTVIHIALKASWSPQEVKLLSPVVSGSLTGGVISVQSWQYALCSPLSLSFSLSLSLLSHSHSVTSATLHFAVCLSVYPPRCLPLRSFLSHCCLMFRIFVTLTPVFPYFSMSVRLLCPYLHRSDVLKKLLLKVCLFNFSMKGMYKVRFKSTLLNVYYNQNISWVWLPNSQQWKGKIVFLTRRNLGQNQDGGNLHCGEDSKAAQENE